MRMGYGTYELRRILGGLAVVAVASTAGTGAARACSVEPYIGDVCMTASIYCPQGYFPMVGQMLAIPQYTALFSVVGCDWGGDCQTTFMIPDMRGRAPVGAGQGTGLTNIPLGTWRGVEQVVLTKEQLPAHTHTARATSQADVEVVLSDTLGASPTPSATNNTLHAVAENAFLVNNKANIYGPEGGANIPMGGVSADTSVDVTVGHMGQSLPINIQNPIMAMTYCIANTGTYPPRP